jgi:hypothetical protein
MSKQKHNINNHHDMVYRLDESKEAWNVDGSSDAIADLGSWIKEAEAATGRKRGRCSYEDCNSPAEVGGHVWIKKLGCFIAPICKKCNYHENVNRMQGSGARLRANIEVTKTTQTEGMRTSVRRFAEIVTARECEECGIDITDRPDDHTVCLACFRGESQRKKGKNEEIRRVQGIYGEGRKVKRDAYGHRCQSCGDDISDQPDDHQQCLSCFRARKVIAPNRIRRHRCNSCGDDISDQPDDHQLCLSCFRSGLQSATRGRFGKRARTH